MRISGKGVFRNTRQLLRTAAEILTHDSKKKENEYGNGECDDQCERHDPWQQQTALVLWFSQRDFPGWRG